MKMGFTIREQVSASIKALASMPALESACLVERHVPTYEIYL